MLDTKEFQEEHTGMQIAAELRDILESWGLSEECLVATTDNGSNIVNALDQLDWINIRCFAHTLQLAVLKVVNVPAVSKALARLSKSGKPFQSFSQINKSLEEEASRSEA